MKKLILLILILSAVLFLFSCDNGEATNESSNESSFGESSIIDETSNNEGNTGIYYETVSSMEGTSWEDYAKLSKTVYTDYQEFINEVSNKNITLKGNFNKDIFKDNYLLVTRIWVASGGFSVYGYYNFNYNDADNTMSIVADIKVPGKGEHVTDDEVNFYKIIILPKELFPDDVSKIPNEIEIIKNGVEK